MPCAPLHRLLTSLVWLVLASALAGCGRTLDRPEKTAAPAPADALAGFQLPLPLDRKLSALRTSTLNGSDTSSHSSGCTDQGSALSIAATDKVEFAVYAFANCDGLDHLTVTLTGGESAEAWVGVADYATGRWSFQHTFAGTPAISLTAGDLSPLGNVYCVVVAPPVDQITVTALQLFEANLSPVPLFTYLPDTSTDPTTIHFDAGQSTAPAGNIVKFEWDMDDDGTFEVDAGSSPQTLMAFNAGVHQVGLRITDSHGGSATVTLPVEVWIHTVAAAEPDGGSGCSLALVNGMPAMTYWYAANGPGQFEIRFIRATAADGSAWGNPVTITGPTDTSAFTCLAIVDGQPAVCFGGQYRTGPLLFCRATDQDGTAWAAPVTLDSQSSTQGGSLCVVDGKPAVAYQDTAANVMRYVQAKDADGSAWNAPLNIGESELAQVPPSMCIVDGHPAVTYDNGNSDLAYAHANDADGASWPSPVLPGGSTTFDAESSLAVIDGRPAIAFCGNDFALYYIQATDADGTAWGQPAPLVNVDQVFMDISCPLCLQAIQGKPAVSGAFGQDNGSYLSYVTATDANGISWNPPHFVAYLEGADQGNSLLPMLDGSAGLAYSYDDATQPGVALELGFLRQP